jgi:hypothetical protein
MRFLTLAAVALVASLATTQTADAGTLTIEKRGMAPAFVWVDGDSHGKVRNRRPVELEVEGGEHEVWVAIESGGTVTRCQGLVNVPGPGATVSITDMRGCEGLTDGYGEGAASAFRGSAVNFTLSNVDAWVQVDGGQALALPQMPFMLNLDPGTHTIVLWRDVMKESVIDQGTVTLEKGQFLPVTCTPGGCMGFDQAPQVIQVFNVTNVVAPDDSGGLNVNITMPDVQLDMTMPADATLDVHSSTSSSSSSSSSNGHSQSSSQGSSSGSCCVNGSYYECPTADAVYQCSGAFMSCMMSCGMMDFDCPDQCMSSHPMDPSSCSREYSKDNSCSQ